MKTEHSSDDIKVLLINQSDASSIISDTFTFGAILGAFYVTYAYIGDNTILEIVLAIAFFVGAVTRGNQKVRRMSGPEALAYLKDRYPSREA